MATILVVEDDPGISRYLSTMLVYDGHVVLTASTAERARELLRVEPGIALLMLDHNLGKDTATGLALLVAVRRAPGHARLPVIVCTGECKPDVLNRFLAHSIAAFIKKPFHPQRLMAEVHRVLDEAAAKERSLRREPAPHVIRSAEG